MSGVDFPAALPLVSQSSPRTSVEQVLQHSQSALASPMQSELEAADLQFAVIECDSVQKANPLADDPDQDLVYQDPWDMLGALIGHGYHQPIVVATLLANELHVFVAGPPDQHYVYYRNCSGQLQELGGDECYSGLLDLMQAIMADDNGNTIHKLITPAEYPPLSMTEFS